MNATIFSFKGKIVFAIILLFSFVSQSVKAEFAYEHQTGNVFPNIFYGDLYATPSFGDVDYDGDLDLILGNSTGDLYYYENTETGYVLRTTESDNPFYFFSAVSNSNPTLMDADNDGDVDLVLGSRNGDFDYFENTRLGYLERYGVDNPFDGFDVGSDSAASLGDADNDGDADLVVGEDNGALYYFENTANGFVERTGSDNPFDGFDVGDDSIPSFGDVDGDGDDDLLVGEYQGALYYFENTETGYVEQTGANNPFASIDVGLRSSPSFHDFDDDGDVDLVVGSYSGSLDYYENTEEGFVRVANSNNPFDGFSVVYWSTPSLGDLDNDGDMDLVVGERDGALDYYEKTANGYIRKRGFDNPFDGIDVGDRSAPHLADIDGDDDLDVVVGNQNGDLYYFENTASGFVERTGSENPFDGFDVGDRSIPSFGDLDGDGDLDLVVGENDGVLNYYENTLSGYVERIGSENPFDGLDFGHRSQPSIADVDHDGDLDIVVGESQGVIYYLEKTAFGYAQRSGSENPFNDVHVWYESSPSFGDVNGDGYLELVLGTFAGRLEYYKITDQDQDGSNVLEDCDDTDASIYPTANDPNCEGDNDANEEETPDETEDSSSGNSSAEGESLEDESGENANTNNDTTPSDNEESESANESATGGSGCQLSFHTPPTSSVFFWFVFLTLGTLSGLRAVKLMPRKR